jgi:serine/threonine protein kinase
VLITFPCSGCSADLEADATLADQDVACPHCEAVAAVPRQEPGPGTTLGGFRIKSLIGQGSMGNVFLATQLSMDRDIALKVLSTQMTRDPEDLERFLNEVRVAARLEHPSIVTAYEAGEDNGYYFMAMAYVGGESLDHRVARLSGLQEKEALSITHKIATALAYAWTDHEMLHRDIKPENILLDTHDAPHLADMGLSKTSSVPESVTLAGTIMGTPNYMSPEHLEELGNADQRSDIYSLGATLYQMLTAKTPFEGTSVLQTFKLIATDFLADPRKLSAKVSLPCLHLMEKMLARNPKLRYQTWKELLKDLDRVRTGKDISGPRLKPGQSVLKVALVPPSASPQKHARPRVATHAKTRTQRRHHTTRIMTPQTASNRWKPVLVVALLVILALVGIMGSSAYNKKQALQRQRTATLEKQRAIQERLLRLKALVSRTLRAVQTAPDQHQRNIVALERALTRGLRGTAHERAITQEISRQKVALARAIEDAWRTLQRDAGQHVSAGDSAGAIAALRHYAGPHAAALADQRLARARELEREAETIRAATQAHETESLAQFKTSMPQLADALVTMDMTTVETAMASLQALKLPEALGSEKVLACQAAQGALDARDRVYRSIKTDEGKTVTLTLKKGRATVKLVAVKRDGIQAAGATGNGLYRFQLDDIHETEWFRRMGTTAPEGEAIIRAVLAARAGSYDAADKYMAADQSLLGGAVKKRLLTLRQAQQQSQVEQVALRTETEAEQAFARLLTTAGLRSLPEERDPMLAAMRALTPGQLTRKRLTDRLAAFQAAHAKSALARQHAAVLEALRLVADGRKPWGAPNPATVTAAFEQLKTDNPGMFSTPEHDMTDGGLTVTLSGPGITTLAAL